MAMRILLILGLVTSVHGCTESAPDTKLTVPTAQVATEVNSADSETAPTENALEVSPAGANAKIQKSDREAILNAVLNDIVSNPDLEVFRSIYGSPNSKQLALVANSGYGSSWPAEYRPVIAGWTIFEEGKLPATSEPYFGVGISKFAPDEKEEKELVNRLFDAPVVVTIMNAGGDKTVIGGCSVYYRPKRDGGNWLVQFTGANDP